LLLAAALSYVVSRLLQGHSTAVERSADVGSARNGEEHVSKTVATETYATFFSVSPSTVTSKYRGESEKLVKKVFDRSRLHAPSTVFIVEIDSLCSKRGIRFAT
jgi:SpoVK/Ycf46/Vps4 family AAA+-type ATPase